MASDLKNENVGYKNPLIICTVTNDLSTDRRMNRICQALADFGANVTLIGFQKEHSKPINKKSFVHRRLKPIFKKGFLFYAEVNIRLFFFLLINRFDIVNAVDSDTVIAGFLASKLKNKKIVFDAHEFFTGVPELEGISGRRIVWKLIENITLPYIGLNYTVSESLKRLYEDQTGQKYEVIRNFPQKADFSDSITGKNSNKKRICYVGYLNKGRGLENAIQALKFLPDHFCLLLVGGGDLENQLRVMIHKLELTDRVEITGWVDPSKISGLLSGCYVGLNLLDENSESYRVSLANKVFDYINLGIPCITMNFEEYKKLNDEYNCFILTDSMEPDVVGKIIIELNNDSHRYNFLVENCRRASEQLNWETEKMKLKTIYFKPG